MAPNPKRDLKRLSDAVLVFLHLLDAEMMAPSTEMRGRRVAKLCNLLDLENDRVRFGALGVNFRKDNKDKAVAKLLRKGENAP